MNTTHNLIETRHLLDFQNETNRKLEQTNLALMVSEEKLSVTLNCIGEKRSVTP